jgi:hypothetical protein
MTGLPLGFFIELLVSVLLATTIVYCVILNRRLTRLKADEQVLRATIGELITATEIAERAILGLKSAAAECDATLGVRLRSAEALSSSLERALGEGDDLMRRLAQITGAGRPREVAAPSPVALPEPPAHAAVRAVQRAAAEASERLKAYRRAGEAAA